MILEKKYDLKYKKWFAWYPVFLYGPDEWDRKRLLDRGARLVWLRFVWRYRTNPKPHYALPWERTRNKLLLDSIAGLETDEEKRMRKND